jgi:ferric-dicitrate binding protein FerR (iron transport regulator)
MDYPLISKYLSGNASEEEVMLIMRWVDNSSENKQAFIQLKKIAAFEAKSDQDCEIAWKQFMQKITIRNRKKKQLLLMKYAAVFAGTVGIAFFLEREISVPQDFNTEGNAITLELENGNIQIITDKEERNIFNKNGKVVAKKQGNTLNYNAGLEVVVSSKPVYNQLTVPFGKTFKLVLSDGTMVYLNAGSSLRYPVKFLKETEREVFLEGEAFFDVVKNEITPFVVNANNLNVRVLGTKFNLSSYPEEESINTVLVEGSVALYEKNKVFDSENITLLEPGHKAQWNKRIKNVSIDKVDTEMYIGWIDGKIIFRDTPFKIIRKKLERHYNISIKNNNKILEEKTYNAKFDIESIEQLLNTLNEIYPIKYTIEKNEIVIN